MTLESRETVVHYTWELIVTLGKNWESHCRICLRALDLGGEHAILVWKGRLKLGGLFERLFE